MAEAIENFTTSWIVVSKDTGKAVMETFNKRVADAVNQEKYEVLPALEYLQRFNQNLKGSPDVSIWRL